MKIKTKVTNRYYIEIDCSNEEREAIYSEIRPADIGDDPIINQLRFAFQPQPTSTVVNREEENDTLKQKVEGLEEIIDYLRILATAISPGRKESK